MENFILYEEIGRGKSSIVYKGRRKGTVKFLAILCIEKDERAAITNWVRLVHQIEHENIVRFYEWYETSNHLWMVVELCTGGTLDEVLNQDGYLPEETVRQFGKDVLLGLSYLHQQGIVFADLCPRKVLLDGPGKLKLTNFCISRLLDERLEDVYNQAAVDDSKQGRCFNLKGNTNYQAPEIARGEDPSMPSDMWAFAALLFHLYTGSIPFHGQDSLSASQNLVNGNYQLPKMKRKANSRHVPQEIREEKPSEEFLDLLKSVFQTHPEERPTAEELLNHPFWHNTEKPNVPKPRASMEGFGGGDATARSTLKSSASVRRDEAGDRLTQRHSLAPESVNVLDSTFTLSSRPHTAALTGRQDQSNDKHIKKSEVSLSQTHTLPQIKNKIESLNSSIHKRPSTGSSVKLSVVMDSLVLQEEVEPTAPPSQELKDLIYHDSDFELSVVQDNPQVRKVEALKWDNKSLPFQSLPSVDKSTPDEVYNHLKQVTQALSQPSSPNFLRIKANVLSYLCHLCTCSCAVANYTINSQLLSQLVGLVKSCMQQSPDVACKAARVIGISASCATELEQCTRVSDAFSILTDALRENFRNIRAKVAIVPALGQLLYLVAEQEDATLPPDEQRPPSQQRSNWSVPSVTYGQITRCLREGEDPVVQHFACKTIEAVCTLTGPHGKRFITAPTQGSSNNSSSHSDVIGPLLWTVSSRATNENLKHAALSAMCRLNKLSGSGSVLQATVDRVGHAALLSVLARASFKCQQALVTSLIETLYSAQKGHAARLANGKDLLPGLMRLFDSPSAMVRGKVILAVLLLLKKIPALLVVACQQRLIMYIEREGRRVAVTSAGQHSTMTSYNDYIQSCLSLIIQHVAAQAPSIAASCINILEETVSRKHPSSNQVKQLRQYLPTCLVLQHLVTSQVFRSQIVTSDFVHQLGTLLSHASVFLKKNTHSSAMTSSIGDDIVQKFIDAVISIVECLSQHPLVITQHAESSMKSLVPNIVALLGAYGNGDGQIVCIKLLTDVLGTLLHYRAMSLDYPLNPAPQTPLKTPPSRENSASSTRSARYRRQDVPDDYGVQELIRDRLIPDFHSILAAKDPLPAYAIRFLGTLLEHWPSLSTALYSHGLVPVLMTSFEKQQSSSLRSYAQGVTTVLTFMMQYNDEVISNQMYEKGLIEHLSTYMSKISSQYNKSQFTSNASQAGLDASYLAESLAQLLMLMKCMLDRVTMFVKQALQSHHTSRSLSSSSVKIRTETAEQLLVDHKSLTDLQSACIELLCSEQELHELALACLSMLVQLYGGDHPDTMTQDNIQHFAHALTETNPKTQRILLKLIKRVVSLNKRHAQQVASPTGSVLVQSIKLIMQHAEKRADSSVATLASDIIEVVENASS